MHLLLWNVNLIKCLQLNRVSKCIFKKIHTKFQVSALYFVRNKADKMKYLISQIRSKGKQTKTLVAEINV